jgi:predicted GIY-YIG superfamily endonuclease
MTYFVYILQADDGRFYTGQTNDLERRIKEHQSGKVQTTKLRTGWRLVHTETFETRLDAVQRERGIKKKKSRGYIERLVRTSRA